MFIKTRINSRVIVLEVVLLSLFFALTVYSSVYRDLTQYVNPFVGTGGHGHTYPGASMPFGMVQLSPDTRLTGWDGCSGYHFSDHVIYGFSHTHLSGTGVPDYCDILFMPTVGKLQLCNGYKTNPDSGYGSRFKHSNETAAPGYYSVILDDYNVKVELTVTKRVGFHKYIFPKTNNAYIIIDLTHRDPVIESAIYFINDRKIQGFRRSRAWAKDQVVYFAAEFSKPFFSHGIAVNNKIKGNLRKAVGKNIKAFVNYHTRKGEPILVKVGISAVSMEGAWKNLEAEIPHWDFEKIKNGANSAWNRALNMIQIEGGTEEEKRIFYTALYHVLLVPNLFMDVDGKYRGTDLKIHQAKNFTNYTVFSLWDTFRAEHPLFTIIQPKRTVDFIRTFIAQYENGGQLPMWELAGNYTGCMIGYHSVPVIVDAYMKGIKNFNVKKAYKAMKHSADQDHLGLKYYKEFGYIPADKEGESVSKTLEYAYDDWCIAQMAKSLNKKEDYKRYIRRAQFYKNLFDPSTGFMRAKLNGSWVTPFDPREVNSYYTEANAWQYSFFVPQDIHELIKMMGGKNAFARKLDQLFSTSSKTSGRHQADITGLIGQYAHGNEPSHHMAYLYDYAGQPWKTQKLVREIMKIMYKDTPDGLSGNEDCGQMSAWYVLSAMGFYSVTPGKDFYVVGSPLFDKVTIHLENGRKFEIIARNVSDKNIYIKHATLNGKLYTKTFIKHSDIIKGGKLVFDMGPQPDKKWGTGDSDIPPSAIKDYPILPVPFVSSGSRVFFDSTEISLSAVSRNTKIYYTLDGTKPTRNSKV
ncbi:MAG: glycoside hydrolase family 92 protein, partial [Candidatus Neomarinimicrobiota bacterium]